MTWNFGEFRKKLDLNLKHEQQRHFCGESNVSRKLPGSSKKTWVSYYLSSAKWINWLLQPFMVSVTVKQEINMCQLSFNEKHAVSEGILLLTYLGPHLALIRKTTTVLNSLHRMKLLHLVTLQMLKEPEETPSKLTPALMTSPWNLMNYSMMRIYLGIAFQGVQGE